MIRKTLFFTTLSVLVLSVGLSWAGPGYGRGGDCLNCDMPKWSCDKKPGGAIDLTDEQQSQLDALREAEFEKLEPLRKEMQELREDMHEVLNAEAIDEEKLRQLAREKADKKVDLKIAKRAFHDKVEQILTPEQVAQLKERRETHHGKHGRHGEKHHSGKKGYGNCYGPGH